MSRLISEDSNWLYLQGYIHNNPDSYSHWEQDSDGRLKYPKEVHESEHYAFYEVKVDYKINKQTGEIVYLNWNA